MSEELRVHVLPGGRMPERKTDGAIGFDVYLRAIVCPHQMDPDNSHLRKTLFNFRDMPEERDLQRNVCAIEDKLVYRLYPGKTVLGGIGFAIEMPFPMFYWVAPRSGLSSKERITLGNAPGTVDPDYRGEAGVVICNEGTKPFDLVAEMRIAQIIFHRALIPTLVSEPDYTKLGISARGAGGFGSTGNHG